MPNDLPSDLSHIENGTPPNHGWSPMFIDREDTLEANFVKEVVLFGTREEIMARVKDYIFKAAQDYVDGKNHDFYDFGRGVDFSDIKMEEVEKFLQDKQITPQIRSWFVFGAASYWAKIEIDILGQPQFNNEIPGRSEEYWKGQYKSVLANYTDNPLWHGPKFYLESLLQMEAWETVDAWIIEEWGKTEYEIKMK